MRDGTGFTPAQQAKALGTKALTAKLKELAAEAIDIDVAGDPVTRRDKLSLLLWNKALGWIEKVRDDEGNLKEISHKPEAWAMTLIWDRIEGKTPTSTPDEGARVKAADRVRELSRERMNQMATAVVGGGKKKDGPPSHKPRK